jgi:NAD(P)-dependent dehydrogenase (short-subunit alcohol dehydrogenase family)
MQDEGWHGVLNVNLHGSFYCIREALRVMTKHSIKGSIVNISSTSALSGEGAPHYAASKAALITLVQTASEEVRQSNVCVNCVAPSVIDTPSNRAANPTADTDRWVSPRDIGAVIAFLCAPESRAITGAMIPVYGRA